MSNRLNFTLLALFMIILTGCRNEDEGKLTFEMLSAEKSVKLSNEELSPLCSVSLKMASATKESGEIGEKINAEVVYRLFNQEGIGIQAAMDQYIEQYCSSYRSHMLPLYNEDRADTTAYYCNKDDGLYYYEQTGEAPLLPAETLTRLLELGNAVERLFAAPMDVEYAVEAGKVWLLQARPITTTWST